MITLCQYVDQTEDTLDRCKASLSACSFFPSNKKDKTAVNNKTSSSGFMRPSWKGLCLIKLQSGLGFNEIEMVGDFTPARC